MERTETRRRGGLAVPLILIAFGLAFLAGNLGLLSWNFWEAAFRLWPLLIVAIGLDVMLGRTSAGAVRTTVGALVIVAMVIGTVAAVTWFSGSNATVESSATVPRADPAAAVVSERISQPLQDAERAKVDLSFGAGSLKVDGGVGKANLDLAGLKVVDLELRTGVGKVDITLPRHGQMKATVEGGVGKTTILIPRGMAARIQVESGLASVDVMGDYQHRGEDYVSPGYDDAVDRVDLFVEGGIGKIAIQEYGF
ncbi:MAG: LiaI-LiaF-like domain-containing protein [Chloroflexota bacterium]